MRYFLDTEFNGFGGELISLALVAEHGDQDYYVQIAPLPQPLHPWVERNVVPYLGNVPDALDNRLDAAAAAHDLAAFLATDRDVHIVADWPEDIALFCRLLLTGPAEIADVGSMTMEFRRLPGFSPAMNSQVPHNALHDARALRAFLLGAERS